MKHYTPLVSTEAVEPTTLNSRLEELNDGIINLARDADEIAYSSTVSWLPLATPETVQEALDGLGLRTGALSAAGYASGLEMRTDPVTNTVTIGPGMCSARDGDALITVEQAIVIDITASGINGKDTGTAAANTWYGVWLVQGPSGVGAVYSEATNPVTSQPTAVDGYQDFMRLIGQIRTDGSAVVRGQITAGGSGTLRRVRYTEVTDAAPFKVLDEANIGDSGSPTAVDLSAVVPEMATAAIAMIEINTPSAAVNIFWGNTDAPAFSLILTLPATAFAFCAHLDLLTYGNPAAGRIYGGAADEDLSLVVMGYIDASLNPFFEIA